MRSIKGRKNRKRTTVRKLVKKSRKTLLYIRNTIKSSTPATKVFYMCLFLLSLAVLVTFSFMSGFAQDSLLPDATKEKNLELRPRKEKDFQVSKDAIQPFVSKKEK